MTELVVIGALIVVAAISAYLLGRERQAGKQAKKTATVARKQSKVASKKRKRRAKGVADDIAGDGI